MSLLTGGWEGKSNEDAKSEWEETKDTFETSAERVEDTVDKARKRKVE